MTLEEKRFIIDTLETAIEWSDYADDYFKKKHNLDLDCLNVKKAISILNLSAEELEATKTCEGCVHFVNNGCETDEWCRRDDSAVDYYTSKEIQ